MTDMTEELARANDVDRLVNELIGTPESRTIYGWEAIAGKLKTIALTARREIDAARAAGAAEWRDIGSAPMDGTWVLLGRWAVEEAGKEPVFRQSVGFWDERLTGTDDWDDDIGDVVYRGGWTDHTVASFTHEEYTELNPSVWMPLQSPPQSGA